MKSIVFWDPSFSPHKVSFINALAKKMEGVEISVFADQGIAPERLALGWETGGSSEVTWHMHPSAETIRQIVYSDPQNTLHIFSGIRWVHSITTAIKHVKQSRSRFAIMHEPRVREGWRGEFRFLQSLLTEGWFRRNAEFILAIGRNGPPWFISVGYSAERVFPFAYFVDPPREISMGAAFAQRIDQRIQVGYVGRLVKMKGIFDLAAAVATMKNNARLRIVGIGKDETILKALCTKINLDVDFLGVLPITDIGLFMAQIDVLVLASTSTDDGWGVVISEALMSGTAVVATPCVGASVLLENSQFGRIVPVNSPLAIAQAISNLKDSGAFSQENRLTRGTAARKILSADAGAHYFLDILHWRFAGMSKPIPFYTTGVID